MPDNSTVKTSHITFVFLDGIGLGSAASQKNPLIQNRLPAFEKLAGGQSWSAAIRPLNQPHHLVKPIDASLDVEGLPQSGTGQATLFTGINCAKIAGQHFGPFPHSSTKSVIAEHNIFSQLGRLPNIRNSAFANAYPDRFFDIARQKNRWSVTTLCCIEAGIPVRSLRYLQQGQAIASDLTGKGWVTHLGYDFTPVSESIAAQRLIDITKIHSLTLFEYYLTDKAGHSQSPEKCAQILSSLDTFFTTLIERIDFASTTLLVTSDHGNIEDLSTKSHTLNPVPLIALGQHAPFFSDTSSITDVTPAIVRALQENHNS